MAAVLRPLGRFACRRWLTRLRGSDSVENIFCIEYISMQSDEFIPLKPQWFHILLALSDQDQHGYGIMQEVLERTGGKMHLWPPTLYGSLKRLVEAGLVAESDKRPAAELDDARRRYYRLTPLGRRVLATETARLEELVRAVHAKSGMRRRDA